jgi:hypothetical protein
MAGISIPALPSASTLNGSADLIVVQQGGVTKKATVTQVQQIALTNAANAQNTANTASSNANTALTNAATAQTTANNALNAANAAQGDADAAQATADSAFALANEGLKYSNTFISSTQLLNIYNEPVQLVAAPGVNKVIIPVCITLIYAWRIGSPYTANTSLIVGHGTNYTNGILDAVFIDALLGNGNKFSAIPTCLRDTSTLLSAIDPVTYANKNLQITSQTANPTGGGGDLRVNVAYYVVTITNI